MSTPGRKSYPDEHTPLIAAAGRRERQQQQQQHQQEDDEERLSEADDIDPDDFDLLLTKSTSYTPGPLLGPESSETPLLRGDRRYSTGHGPHHHKEVVYSRRPSVCSEEEGEAVVDEEAGEGGGDGDDYDDDDDDDDDKAPPSPFHGAISYGRFWLIFSNVLALNFISNFDSTLMASSHPVITSYFHSSNSASWLSTAFLLTSTASQPLLGSLSDTVGRRTPYILTMAVFALATLWCALAQSMASFVAARATCGLGAGGVMILGSIIVSDLVPIEHRGAYQSYLNAVYGVGATLGAALGGFMADYLGWRWEFGIQVPPLLLCVGISILTIPHDLGLPAAAAAAGGVSGADGASPAPPREAAATTTTTTTFLQAMRTFDLRGSVLLTSAITSLILGLNLGGNVLPWSHPFVLASLAISCIAFPLFLRAETTAARPIMPLHLVRRAPHANMIFSNALAAFMMNAIMFNMPLFFQAVLLTSATTSGLCLMIITVVSSAAGTATGFLVGRTRRLKWPMTLGTLGFLLGTAALSSMQRGWPLPAYLLCLAPHATGQGFQFPGTFLALLAASEQRDQAAVTSTLILWRSVGMVLGVAASSLVVQNALWRYLDLYVTDAAARAAGFASRDEVVGRVRESVEAVAGLAGAVREQVVESYEAAVRTTFLCCVAVALASVLILWPVKLPRLGERKK